MEGWMEGKHGKGGMSPRKEGEHPPKVRGEFYGVKSVVREADHTNVVWTLETRSPCCQRPRSGKWARTMRVLRR